MADLKMIEDLSNAFGPSGFEEEVVQAIKKHGKGLVLSNDAMNNVYARIKGKKEKRPVLMLDAHSDECGFMVQAVLENGLLSVVMLGGFHLTSLPAHSVIVKTTTGKKHRGIIIAKPVHFLTAAQKSDHSMDIEDIKIDVGACSRQEVLEVYGIRPGDAIVPEVTFEYNKENQVCFGKAFDNRLGCMCILETMKALVKESDQLSVELVGGFAAQEEVGTRGATVTSQQIKPDLAIVFEGSPSDDFFFSLEVAQCRMKEGVQIRHMDNSYISSPQFIQYAQEIGDKFGIPYQDAVRRGGSTNAGKISLTHQAVPVLVLGIPTRYVHSHYNFCAAKDIDATVQMAVEVIRGLDQKRIDQILRKGLI